MGRPKKKKALKDYIDTALKILKTEAIVVGQ